ncbi:MAG: hypothetical protein ACP5VE_03400 [Chthonomonadales bacterium]
MAGFDPLSSIERLGLIRVERPSAPAQFAGGNQQIRGGEARRQHLEAALEDQLSASINRIRERLQGTYTAETSPADGPGRVDILA